MSTCKKLKFEPIEDDDDIMLWDVFVESCQRHHFIDYDGFGDLATSNQKSNITISPSRILAGFKPPSWATHVVWYNR